MKNTLFIISLFILFSCKQQTRVETSKTALVSSPTITQAQGFSIADNGDYKTIRVTGAFPEQERPYTYIVMDSSLSRKRKQEIKKFSASAHIEVPVSSIVVTSTTHIPSLEMLGVINALVGFPNHDYISSQKTRDRIKAGAIKELGQNESINTEVTIDLNPDVVVSFGVEGENKAMESIARSGIPVLYNGDWVEQNPLGKAEWIKFFGVLFGKEIVADSIFAEIERDYIETKKLAQGVQKKPTVMSGAMFKDVWYLPHGNSWPAKMIADAGGNYLWKDTEGTGSISLSIESVLEKAQTADFWVAPAQYASYSKLEKDNPVYAKFEAFQNRKAYTFATKKGETGGLLYYELAPNRPDLVLKDLVHFLHPNLLPDYEPQFFTPLGE
ncbi:ABC transporter substrate-binding protein [Dokdonia sinensis]|uniref:ABC transporter substrate-binding protein n=1 Tax=Dokdonia sinensis TaxID=2479847 RepID=UPI001F48B816|nr:ABC transporter substrate-binding protein [Dokdonia sinensis]